MGVSKKCPTTLSDKEQAIGFHGKSKGHDHLREMIVTL
jgi:hypothetical protein